MNNKGFTLTELIIVVAIMGLIAVIAFPTIVDLQKQQKDAKYYVYEDAAIETAKLYTDQVKEDIGGKEGCFTITKDQLVATGLLDEFKDAATTGCDFNIQYTIDGSGHEDYKIHMWCKTTDLEEYPSGFTYGNPTDIILDDSCDVIVPNGEYCRYTEKKYIDDFSSCSNASGKVDCGGGIQTRSYTLVSIYDETINCANDVKFTETRSCNTHDCLEADNLIVTSISKNSAGTTYVGGLDVNIKFNHVDGREMYISTTGYETGGSWQTIDDDFNINLKTLNNSYSLNGSQIKIYVTIKDVYGNTVDLNAVTYTFHNQCSASNTEDVKTTWSGCNKACGGGIDTATITNRDKVTLASCPTTYSTRSCNTHSCLDIKHLNVTSNVGGYNSTNIKTTFSNTGGVYMWLYANNILVYEGAVNTNLNLDLKHKGFTLNGGNVSFVLRVQAADKSQKSLTFNYRLYQECTNPTFTETIESEWSACSKTCNALGNKTRTVSVVSTINNDVVCSSKVESAECRDPYCEPHAHIYWEKAGVYGCQPYIAEGYNYYNYERAPYWFTTPWTCSDDVTYYPLLSGDAYYRTCIKCGQRASIEEGRLWCPNMCIANGA